jgi:hypothetical protein
MSIKEEDKDSKKSKEHDYDEEKEQVEEKQEAQFYNTFLSSYIMVLTKVKINIAIGFVYYS